MTRSEKPTPLVLFGESPFQRFGLSICALQGNRWRSWKHNPGERPQFRVNPSIGCTLTMLNTTDRPMLVKVDEFGEDPDSEFHFGLEPTDYAGEHFAIRAGQKSIRIGIKDCEDEEYKYERIVFAPTRKKTRSSKHGKGNIRRAFDVVGPDMAHLLLLTDVSPYEIRALKSLLT